MCVFEITIISIITKLTCVSVVITKYIVYQITFGYTLYWYVILLGNYSYCYQVYYILIILQLSY